MHSQRFNSRTSAQLLLLGVAFVWGAAFVLVKAALVDVSPLLFNLLRMTLATVALLVINRKHLRGITQRQLVAGCAVGFFLALGYQLQTLGLARTSSTKAAFITGLVVVFVPAFTLIPRLRPPGTPPVVLTSGLGAIVAFAGLILITTPAGTPARNLLASIGTGDLLCLGCAVAFAAHMLTLSYFATDIPPGLLATTQIAACTLIMLLTLPLEDPHILFTPRVLVALAICSLLATAAAFTIQSFAQQTLPPTQTALLLTFEPVFAWLTSIVILHQSLDRRSLLGAALIVTGLTIVEILPGRHTTELPA